MTSCSISRSNSQFPRRRLAVSDAGGRRNCARGPPPPPVGDRPDESRTPLRPANLRYREVPTACLRNAGSFGGDGDARQLVAWTSMSTGSPCSESAFDTADELADMAEDGSCPNCLLTSSHLIESATVLSTWWLRPMGRNFCVHAAPGSRCGLLVAHHRFWSSHQPWRRPNDHIPERREKVAAKDRRRGYVTTGGDTTSDCFPGITYHQINTISFETASGETFDAVHSVSVPGQSTCDHIEPTKNVGRLMSLRGSICAPRTTARPTEPDPEPLPPNCKSQEDQDVHHPGEEPKEDDLHPLKGVDMILMIMRTGGGSDNPRAGARLVKSTAPAGESVFVGSASFPGRRRSSHQVPDGPQLFNEEGTEAQHRVWRAVFQGHLKVYKGSGPAPSQGAVNADGDCYRHVEGQLTVSPPPGRSRFRCRAQRCARSRSRQIRPQAPACPRPVRWPRPRCRKRADLRSCSCRPC